MTMTTAGASIRVPEWVYAELSEGLAEQTRAAAPLIRPPDEVMGQPQLRAMTASKLSFAQSLIRRMTEHRWSLTLQLCDVAADGTGFLAYDIRAEELHLSFGVFVYPPLPLGHQRLFRDTKVEFLGILLDGPVDVARFERERAEFDGRLWRGRTDSQVYGWTIASRGTRTFEDVVDTLVSGRQPDVTVLDANGGYLIRNGGYYGNGRMGTRAWHSYASAGGALSTAYHVDLFSVYLWRLVSLDLVDATARARNPRAAALDPSIRRHVGIGNSSGLGTVAALVRWPARLSAYILARELAFAYVKSRPGPILDEPQRRLHDLLTNAAVAYRNAPAADPELLEPRDDVSTALLKARAELDRLASDAPGDSTTRPWSELVETVRTYGSPEAVEVLHALLLELYPEVVEFGRVTVAGMVRPQVVDPTMSVGELRHALEAHFSWALTADLESAGKREFFWYRSEENGENRRGERSVDVGVERETFMDVAGTSRRLYDFLADVPASTSVGRFLLEEPEHALAVARVQLAEDSPFSELRASVCDTDFLASNGIRCFLAVLGIELPTPHSGRWVRGLFFRGAPLPEDLAAGREDQWGIGAPTTVVADNRSRDDDAVVGSVQAW
jgi:hypothetical protein